MITQHELKEVLDYDPATGVFVWRVSPSQRVRAGTVAGCLNPSGYRRIKVGGRLCMEHRLAFLYMTGKLPPHDTDHINGHRDDNRWVNLRSVSRSENQRNRAMSTRNTSGICGVSWYTNSKCWHAQVFSMHLGYFPTMAEAVAARKAADRKYGFSERHGEPLAA
jgi:hypothetical protein